MALWWEKTEPRHFWKGQRPGHEAVTVPEADVPSECARFLLLHQKGFHFRRGQVGLIHEVLVTVTVEKLDHVPQPRLRCRASDLLLTGRS